MTVRDDGMHLFPQDGAALSSTEQAFLVSAGFSTANIDAALRSASRNATTIYLELMAQAPDQEALLYRCLAQWLGAGFVGDVAPDRLIIDADDQPAIAASHSFVHYRVGKHDAVMLIAPSPRQLRKLIMAGRFAATDAARIAITTPFALRGAIIERSSRARLRQAVNGHAESRPTESARHTLTGMQGWVIGMLIAITPSAVMLYPAATLSILQGVVMMFFLSCVVLRAWAAFKVTKRTLPGIRPYTDAELPRYAVLVALYKETEVAAQLVASLQRIKWPASKLEVYLICEADDQQTMAALRAAGLPAGYRIVSVPSGGPRTKPKALMYALPLVRAEYLVLYDAEDRPHPEQLLEAWQALTRDHDPPACVQAPLEIANRAHSMLTRMFAFEYAALFRGLLPALSSRRLFVPLGGTSNHFRVSALRDVGGWDPYNVTEDADLGMRLHAHGHHTGMIARPTFEDAPDTIPIWIKQRTRWYKGFIQTWLISLRHPRRLLSVSGGASFLVMQIMLGGLVLSALVHPFLLVSAILMLALMATGQQANLAFVPMAMIDWISLLLGYAAFMALGSACLRLHEQDRLWRTLAAIPAYWMLQSWAAWRALLQINRNPHLWEKTPHKPKTPNG
ncbi:MAG: glycosyltransferase [Phyllobacteriaceae bacterium]|nr:glycosyltransferase [Phyllobacteriaceae bacterium]